MGLRRRQSVQRSQRRPRSAVVGPSKPRLFKTLGPGLITGASDDDPSGIATYSQAGAQFGYGLGWTLVFTYPLMVVVQAIAARIGRTTGAGLAGTVRQHYPKGLLYALVALLFTANTLNIGADLGAMADGVRLLAPSVNSGFLVLAFGLVCTAGQVFLKHTRYVAVLKWLTISLFAYFAVLGVVHVPWGEVAMALFVPHLGRDRNFWLMVVAILGTTISPYLFFWQAAQEVEDTKARPTRDPLKDHPEQGPRALARINLDTSIGMAFSNLVALSILITAAATLHAGGTVDIQSSQQAAAALRPLAGDLAFALFALGICGTGLLAVPVLAGSAAYAVGEARGWPVGLDRKPGEARAFYLTIALATFLGAAGTLTSISPVRALVWSAVINAFVAVPTMALMMLIASSRRVMGEFRIGPGWKLIGWAATLLMAAASLVLVFSGVGHAGQ